MTILDMRPVPRPPKRKPTVSKPPQTVVRLGRPVVTAGMPTSWPVLDAVTGHKVGELWLFSTGRYLVCREHNGVRTVHLADEGYLSGRDALRARGLLLLDKEA